MRVTVIVLALFLGSCQALQTRSQVTTLPPLAQGCEIKFEVNRSLDKPIRRYRIFPEKPRIAPDGRESCAISGDYPDFRYLMRQDIERGTIDGVRYRIYKSDGSGSVQGLPTNTLSVIRDKHYTNWDLSCNIDLIEDTHSCTLRRANMWLVKASSGLTIIGVGHSHYPGTDVVIRIDGKTPFRANKKNTFSFSRARAEAIIAELKTGRTFITRYQEWPYQSYKDERASLFGFKAALAVLDWLVANLDRRAAAEKPL